MIIKVSTADEVAAANNGGAAGTPCPPSYSASQSALGSTRSVVGGSSGSPVLSTTHVLAPVSTSASTKKTKFPDTPGEFPSCLLCDRQRRGVGCCFSE